MGDRFIHNLVSSCCSHKAAFCSSFQYFSPATAAHVLPEIGFLIDLFPSCALHNWAQSTQVDLGSQKGHDTPLSPSHAGDKGDSNHGHRPVDMAVLPRPSSPRKGKEEGKAAVSVPSNQPFWLLPKSLTKNYYANVFAKEVFHKLAA